jgi:SAM-dependent methyltransferase
MSKAYQKLCTEFYDLSKPQAGVKEVQFYANYLKNGKGPFLEAMCGSGRLLIPLLERGLSIDGLDNSAEMLASCSKRCKAKNLKVNVFNQPLQDLSLPTKYGLIFIAIGSFQLIEDRSEALIALKKLYDHLLPGGVLLLETFIPWDGIKDCIAESILLDKWSISFEKKINSTEESEIVHKGKSIVYPREQFEISESCYEKIFNQKVVAKEEERLAVRWYYRYEMELFLEKSGFSKVQIWDEAFELNPQAAIYQATK